MRLIILKLCILLSMLLSAQAPALIPYQAIVRDPSGQPMLNSAVNARFTIHEGEPTGEAIWQELQAVNTGATGLITVQLGSSIPLANIDWASGGKFLQMEIDLGSGFVDIGTQQMLSVPYALHASNVRLDVSEVGDTLFVGDNSYVIIPGVSDANDGGGIDQEGQSFSSVVIGTQDWMNENLNVAKYSDGTPIPKVTNSIEWSALTTGAWCWYNNDSASYAAQYGRLYNWYAVAGIYDEASAADVTLRKQLAPTGWHVPNDVEWSTLINFLDSTAVGGINSGNIAGGKMKTTGTIEDETGFWLSPNTGATNSSDFSGAPGGARSATGLFSLFGSKCYFWTASDTGVNNGLGRQLIYNGAQVGRFAYFKREGFSVRCVRD